MTTSDRPSIFEELGIPELPGSPSSEDQLFSTQEDWWNNACMNWSSSGWSLYASGYKSVLEVLKHTAKTEEDIALKKYELEGIKRKALDIDTKK